MQVLGWMWGMVFSWQVYRLQRSQRIPCGRDEVFAFHGDAANLESVTPVEMRPGARIEYSLALFGIPFRWRTVITRWEPGVCFVDEQEAGPHAFWRHAHRFADDGDATAMTDTVEYALPRGPIGRFARWLFVRCTLEHIFDFRRDTIAQRFATAASGFATTPASPGRRAACPGQGISEFDVEVFRDGQCPLCAREIALLRRLDRRRRIRFVDIAAPGFDVGTAGLSRDALMQWIHGRLPHGSIVAGVEVFRRLYAAVGFTRLVASTRLPRVALVLDRGYGCFAANRLRLTGRCKDGACAARSATTRV